MAAPTPEDAAVAAFYARVVRRVCDAFRERDAVANAAVAALLAEKWRQRVECYTGVAVDEPKSEAADAPRPSDDDASAVATAAAAGRLSTTNHIAAAGPGSRRPQSVFAAMLGSKRSISQVDGAQDDDDDDDDDDDGEQEEKTAEAALMTPSSEVAAVLNPAWGFTVSAFPLQLSAEHSRFEYRQRRRDFYGHLSWLLLTLTRPLRPGERVCGGQLLWLRDERAFANESKGGTVEVVGASSGRPESLVVKLPDGASVTVDRLQLQRYYERIAKTGKVWFAVRW